MKMRHPKRDRKANVPEDRVDMYRSQGWVEDDRPAKKSAPPKVQQQSDED